MGYLYNIYIVYAVYVDIDIDNTYKYNQESLVAIYLRHSNNLI